MNDVLDPSVVFGPDSCSDAPRVVWDAGTDTHSPALDGPLDTACLRRAWRSDAGGGWDERPEPLVDPGVDTNECDYVRCSLELRDGGASCTGTVDVFGDTVWTGTAERQVRPCRPEDPADPFADGCGCCSGGCADGDCDALERPTVLDSSLCFRIPGGSPRKGQVSSFLSFAAPDPSSVSLGPALFELSKRPDASVEDATEGTVRTVACSDDRGREESVRTVAYPQGTDDYVVRVDERGAVRTTETFRHDDRVVTREIVSTNGVGVVTNTTTAYLGGATVARTSWAGGWRETRDADEYDMRLGNHYRRRTVSASDLSSYTAERSRIDMLGRAWSTDRPGAGGGTVNYSTTFDGASDSHYGYDCSGNVASVDFLSYGFAGWGDECWTTLEVGHDALGRETTRTDTFGHVVTNAYDALGQPVLANGDRHPVSTGHDASGNRTRLATTRDGGATGDAKTRIYDSDNRVNGYTLGGDGTSNNGISVSVFYVGHLPIGMTYAFSNGNTMTLALTREPGRATWIKRRDYAFNDSALYWHRTVYDAEGRPTETADSLTATRPWLYNRRSELIGASGTQTHPYDYAYSYDSIGNRLTSSDNFGTATYAANSLNQYTAVNRTIGQSEQLVLRSFSEGGSL